MKTSSKPHRKAPSGRRKQKNHKGHSDSADHGGFFRQGKAAMTIDRYIEDQSRRISSSKLREMQRFLPALSAKALQAVTEGRYEMVLDIDRLKKIAGSKKLSRLKKRLPRAWAEAGVALDYLVKGVDLIPDFIEGIGLADDEVIIRRVMERNPILRGSPSET